MIIERFMKPSTHLFVKINQNNINYCECVVLGAWSIISDQHMALSFEKPALYVQNNCNTRKKAGIQEKREL